MSHSKDEIADWFKGLQDRICKALEKADGKGIFQEDLWERPGGGGGRTRLIEGAKIEKGGVNFSAVHGALPEKIAAALKLESSNFFATGVSIVLHPKNPHTPIIHMNVRYFELDNGTYWFGGGIDLTPHYIVAEDAAWFHTQLKNACDKHHNTYYPEFKKWADDYFYIKHRKETRGVGGIFFDRLSTTEQFDKSSRFDFVKEIGNAFAPIYCHFLAQNSKMEVLDKHLEWQSLRRSRYVEFNLVWDKGTKFGLDTDGRTESILMSMPPMAKWVYCYEAEKGSNEEFTLLHLKKEIDWINSIFPLKDAI